MNSLNLFEWNDKIDQTMFKFSKHPSILEIRQKIEINKLFSLSLSDHTVKNVVNILLSNIATAGEFPVDVLKMAGKSFDLVN